MIPGTVDRRTRNVPLRLEGGYDVHFEGRGEDGRVLVRLARATRGPVRAFVDAADLHAYLRAALPKVYTPPNVGEVDEWLDLRVAELPS
jgi:hypothetical protein